MSWNRNVASLLIASLLSCWIHPALGGEVCPSRNAQPLRFVDVFDGSPEELATLIPDWARKSSGYWQLGYVYDANRFVTIRCKYADGHTFDVKLSNRIDRCDYKINAKKALTLHCK
jgi:hypothetical protein